MTKRQFIASLALLALLGWPGGASAQSLLETTVFRKDDITAFTKWTGMLARFEDALSASGGACPPSGPGPCPAQDWDTFISELS